MPIAKPAAIEKILYHMANVGNLAPRYNKYGNEVISQGILAEAAGQQRLPLYSKKFMQDFDTVTGAMSEGKLSNIAENLISPEEFKRVIDRNPDIVNTPFYQPSSWAHDMTGGVALPEEGVLSTGPVAIIHEGRHLEQFKGKFGMSGSQPVFDVDFATENVSTKPGIFGGKQVTNMRDVSSVLSRSNLIELDATMSEIGTYAKAGLLDKMPGDYLANQINE